MKKKKVLYVIIILCLVLDVLVSFYSYKEYKNYSKIEEENNTEKIKEEKIALISSHYDKKVITNKDSKIYLLEDDSYIEAGLIGCDIVISLKDMVINENTMYFEIDDFKDNYYISYGDVDKYTDEEVNDDRYKNYILFNENIVTGDITEFYDGDKLVYKFNKSFNLPIIIKDDDSYFVEYNNRLLEVKKDSVREIVSSNNSNQEVSKNLRVIAYHAFYNVNDDSEKWCRSSICHPVTQIEEESKYLKDNNYFTLNTKELDMFIDGKINVPKKSIMITIDDGLLAERGLEVLVKYELNATLFLITKNYKPESFVNSKYIEYHSHGNDLHNVGVCSGGQGGGIKCLNKDVLINDLKTSSEILHGSTIFCYPFYEFNNYSIEVLKEAGYTMAFAGCIGSCKVNRYTNKYIIPRYTITNDVSLGEFINIIK